MADKQASDANSTDSTQHKSDNAPEPTRDPAALIAMDEILQKMQLQALGGAMPKKEHKFWDTQPVVRHGEEVTEEGAIEAAKKPEEIRDRPLPLPNGFEWCTVDVEKEEDMTELYKLLTENYVEDDDAMFRFDYSPEFLNWALKPPGWHKEWHVGVRVSSSRKLVAFIAGIPVHFRIRQHQQLMAEINFLCILKKLRNKRLAPVLIKEVTRRIHLKNIFQAIYTAGNFLPRPVARCRYYHRSLNPKKLVETGFTTLPRDVPLKRFQLRYSLPKETSTKGLRPMRAEDAPQVLELLNRYLARTDFAPVFTSEEEIKHWLLHREGVIWSYVVENRNGKITDLFSYYAIPSQVINPCKHKAVNVAYQFYYASETAFNEGDEKKLAERLQVLFKDALILARQNNFDVMNCLELMDNHHILEELRFAPGDGTLNYYVYNYKCRPVDNSKIGLFML